MLGAFVFTCHDFHIANLRLKLTKLDTFLAGGLLLDSCEHITSSKSAYNFKLRHVCETIAELINKQL